MDAQNPGSPRAAKPLSPKARRFVTEYLLDCNGTQAVIRAGYSRSGASVQATRLLANPSIAQAIHDAQDQILQSNQVTVARIVRELALIAFLDPAKVLDQDGRPLRVCDLPPDIRRALPAIEITESAAGNRRFRFAGKLAALIALGRHMAMFTNRIGNDPTDLPPFDPDSVPDDDDEDQDPFSEPEAA